MTTSKQKYQRAKKASQVPGMPGYVRVMSGHAVLSRASCSHGHPSKKYGVFNATGYLRCRKCMTRAQIRYAKRKQAAQ